LRVLRKTIKNISQNSENLRPGPSRYKELRIIDNEKGYIRKDEGNIIADITAIMYWLMQAYTGL
jgi:hypothetical protein